MKLTITNDGATAARIFNPQADLEIDIPAGSTVEAEVPSGSLLIDLTGAPEATMEAFRAFQKTGSLGD